MEGKEYASQVKGGDEGKTSSKVRGLRVGDQGKTNSKVRKIITEENINIDPTELRETPYWKQISTDNIRQV